jgi:transposase
MKSTSPKHRPKAGCPAVDGRRLSRAKLITLRRKAVRRVLAGERQSDVLRKLGLSRTWLARQLDLHKSSGPAALDRPARGIRPSLLSPQQFAKLLHAAIRHDLWPGSAALPLWSCETLAAQHHYARRLRSLVVTLRTQLARIGIAAPIAPWNPDEDKVPVNLRRWKDEAYTAVQTEARQAKVPIWFVTKVNVKALPLPALFKEFAALQVWLAVGGRGEFRFMFAGAGEMAGTVPLFIRRLLADKPRPVVLVMDAPQHPIVLRTRWPARHSLLTVAGGGMDALMRF